jgi:hypothetical protein
MLSRPLLQPLVRPVAQHLPVPQTQPGPSNDRSIYAPPKMAVPLALKFALWAAIIAAAIYGSLEYFRRPQIPAHFLHHTIIRDPALLTPDQGDALLRLVKQLRDFPVVSNAEGGFYNLTHEHIGEARPIGRDGTCSHPYLVPSADRTLCVLPGRIDVGRHLLLSGGTGGLKERHSVLVSRVLSFMRYHFDVAAVPEVAGLFDSPRFQEAATAVCPPGKRVLDPFQFNLIAQVRGVLLCRLIA